MSYDVIEVKYTSKNAQISENDFGKPQNWEISYYHSKLKFLGIICE